MNEYLNTTYQIVTVTILSISLLELLYAKKVIKHLRTKNKLPCQTYYTGKDSHLDFKLDEILITDEFIQLKDCNHTFRFKLKFADDVDYYSYQEDGWMLSNDSKQKLNRKLESSPSILYGFHVDLFGKVDKLYIQVYNNQNRY